LLLFNLNKLSLYSKKKEKVPEVAGGRPGARCRFYSSTPLCEPQTFPREALDNKEFVSIYKYASETVLRIS
jgi:hypothetical protein